MPTYIADAISNFFTEYGTLLLLGAMMVGLILLTVIPQRKQRKKVEQMLDAMKAGDHVRTVGGFYGVIESIDGDVAILKLNPTKKRIAISRQSISVVGNSDVENTLSDTVK